MGKLKQGNTVKEIIFSLHGAAITVPINSVVTLYIKEGYAEWDGKRFDIFKDEYALTV